MGFALNMNSDTVQETHAPHLVCVEDSTPLAEVLTLLKTERTGGVLVLRGGKLAGIYTERDALRLMANGGDLKAPVGSVMTANPVTVGQSDTIATAIRKMSQGGYRRLPIVDGEGKPTGTIKASGILRYLVEHFPQSIYNLPPAPDNTNKEREGA
jgi:CBS domain-containing protein